MEAESGPRTARWISVVFVVLTIGLVLFVSLSGPQTGSKKTTISSSADLTTCAGRLGSLGAALRMYAVDYDGRFPTLQTPGDADRLAGILPDAAGITAAQLRCPAFVRSPYLYHCYRTLNQRKVPKWMDERRVITTGDPAEKWIASDVLLPGSVGPHSETTKMFNFLRVDGSVQFSAAQPRTVYQ